MLRGVYEDNRRIKDGGAAGRARRRRRLTLGVAAVLSLVLLLVVASELAGTDAEGSGLSPGATTILDANLPVPSSSFELGPILNESEFRELLADSTPLATLFGLQIRTIVLDPGHGGSDPGAVGLRRTLEKDITLDVALRLRRRLEQRGYDVLMTRTEDQALTLRERVEFANSRPTDLFVSIHANSFPDEPTNALETYYFGANTARVLLRLAETENQGSDYTVADFNDMIQRLSSTVKLQESRHLALAIQRSLVTNTRRILPDVADWGAKAGPFVVLLGSDAPSVLAEISVLTNNDQVNRLRSSAHREQLAGFIEEGVLNYLIERTSRDTSAPQ
jgi:N-acetylmuramoyl-L-alanine amidase